MDLTLNWFEFQIIALALLVAVAAADKLPTGRQVAILRSLNEAKDDGSFNYK